MRSFVAYAPQDDKGKSKKKGICLAESAPAGAKRFRIIFPGGVLTREERAAFLISSYLGKNTARLSNLRAASSQAPYHSP
jgi:hypothetical protein